MTTTASRSDTRALLLETAQGVMARKGFAAVGLNEVLREAGVPKGSFYHYFDSKDAFGEAMMRQYFTEYLDDMDRVLATPERTAAERLLAYFDTWTEKQGAYEGRGKCLAVKLSAEVADVSEAMRQELKAGVAAIVERIERTLAEGAQDGSVRSDLDAGTAATTLYDLWLGASVVGKIDRSTEPLRGAMAATRHLLGV